MKGKLHGLVKLLFCQQFCHFWSLIVKLLSSEVCNGIQSLSCWIHVEATWKTFRLFSFGWAIVTVLGLLERFVTNCNRQFSSLGLRRLVYSPIAAITLKGQAFTVTHLCVLPTYSQLLSHVCISMSFLFWDAPITYPPLVPFLCSFTSLLF